MQAWHVLQINNSGLPFLLFSYPFRALAEVTDILEPKGLQEEAELPAQILAQFVVVSMETRHLRGCMHAC